MLSDPHSPKPSRWILEMFASDIPAWYTVFNLLEKKPLGALDETLVHSFHDYLRRKGYLTERQVEVLEGIAKKHNVPLPPIPPLPHHSESSLTKQESNPWSALLRQIRMPELEKPENAKWLALLIDTEGSLGWTRRTLRRDRINDYKYVHRYYGAYISAEMNEVESKETVEEAARLIGVYPRSRRNRITGEPTRFFVVEVGRAIETMRQTKPHLVKFRRLANLCLTLFKHHTYIPLDQFEKITETLFGRHVTSKEANEILLAMTEEEYTRLIDRASKLSPK